MCHSCNIVTTKLPARVLLGAAITFHFCPACGATVHYTCEGLNDVVAIPVGAFGDSVFPAPTVSVYEERMHAWVAMPADIEHMD